MAEEVYVDNEEQRDEVTALQSIFGEDFSMQHFPNSETAQYELELKVCVEVPARGLDLEVADTPPTSPCGEDTEARAAAATPHYTRTVSGHDWLSNMHVSHLPPLRLHVTLPLSYPSSSPPIFTLSCMWLDWASLSAMCGELDTMWRHQAGTPVIFTWVDWLTTNATREAQRTGVVTLAHDSACPAEERDPRALPEWEYAQEALCGLLSYNEEREAAVFASGLQECGVCCDVKPGREFVRLRPCQHHFCRACMTDYCGMHVADGTVQYIRCPDEKCDHGIPPYVVHSVLGDEAYQRWERLQLQRALDTMGDVVWCPRCAGPVVREGEENHSHCLGCIYSFCMHCDAAWTPSHRCATLNDHLDMLSIEEREVVLDILQNINNPKGGETPKQVSENVAKALKKIQSSNILDVAFLRKISKRCPKCHVPIQKNGGCNKVHCTQCHQSLCWLCGKAIKDYSHFRESNGKCTVFSTAENDPFVPAHLLLREEHEGQVRMRAVLNAGLHGGISPCPRCRQRCLKENRNNHIRCWQCKSNFCFLCRSIISEKTVGDHFRPPSNCPQHS